jgi:outer membrane protein assembly factor BamC
MRGIIFTSRWLLGFILLQSITACSWFEGMFPDRSQDYDKAKTTSSLEVPPDLTTTSVTDALVVPDGSTTLSDYTTARETLSGAGGAPVLPSQEGLSFERDRDRAWLVVQGEPVAVWPRAYEFWLENGFLIVSDNPEIGILQTDWVENRAAIPKGVIRGVLGRIWDSAYSSAYRDRFRMRLEYGQRPGTTELYVSHQGIEEVLEPTSADIATAVWAPRPRDPGLESEMLKRIMVYLGVSEGRADQLLVQPEQQTRARAELIQLESGQSTLTVREDYSRAWRSVGIALDRVDFAVEDRDHSQGIYFVRYNDPLKGRKKKGALSKLAFWSDDDEQDVAVYQIKLSSEGSDTAVVVLNAEGEVETSATVVRILTLLYEELR